MRIFYSQDKRDAADLLSKYGENIGFNNNFITMESSFIYDVYLKIHDNAGMTVIVSADKDFRLSQVAEGLKGDINQRRNIYEQINLSAKVN